MDMRRYLLVVDMDFLSVDERLNLQPISYLVTRQEQEPCEVVVLSLADPGQTKLPAMELLLGAQIGKFPVAPRPDHNLTEAAEHRMELTVRHLKTIGCQASGIISDEDLVPAVRAETSHHHFDEVILAVGQQPSPWLARALHLDPVHQLRRRLGKRLVTFAMER
jgi:hypothetical protein